MGAAVLLEKVSMEPLRRREAFALRRGFGTAPLPWIHPWRICEAWMPSIAVRQTFPEIRSRDLMTKVNRVREPILNRLESLDGFLNVSHMSCA